MRQASVQEVQPGYYQLAIPSEEAVILHTQTKLLISRSVVI